MDERLKELILSVKPSDKKAMEEAAKRQDSLAKPPGSLGLLEEISIRLAGMTGSVKNRFEKKALLVFASDNGVVEEGVSSAPQSVTYSQTINIAHGKTGAGVLAAYFGCDVTVCDVGVNADINDPKVLNRKIAYGTKNIAKGPAMSEEEAVKAVLIGAELAMESKADIIGVGEMGIGNTTTSTAVIAIIANVDAGIICGRGGGVNDESFERKKEIIRKVSYSYDHDRKDVIKILSHAGGFDIAAMCGAFIGAAASGRPVVIDGIISAAAALCAVTLCGNVKDYIIAGHRSAEPAYMTAVNILGLEPFLSLGMRLGEGSGCPIAFQVIDAACAVMNNMATFNEAGINDDYLEEIRELDKWED